MALTFIKAIEKAGIEIHSKVPCSILNFMMYGQGIYALDTNELESKPCFFYRKGESPPPAPKKNYRLYLAHSRCTGGFTGGNCWGDTPTAIEPEPVKDFTILDKVLLAVCPDIPYLKYKELKEKHVVIKTWSEYSYYSNSEDYEATLLCLEDVFNFLKANNLINKEMLYA